MALANLSIYYFWKILFSRFKAKKNINIYTNMQKIVYPQTISLFC